MNNASAGPYQAQPDEVIDPSQVPVFRGGTSFRLKPGEVKFDRQTGFVLTTHGPSLDSDPSHLQQFGGAYKVISTPPELQIMQRGRRLTHFEVMPRTQMSLQMFQQFLNQIALDSNATT